MRDLLYPENQPEQDPIAKARKAMAIRPLPKRFYTEASVAELPEGFAIQLDGKIAKTPARNVLALSTRAAAELVASEWQAVTDVIDPSRMPLTRIVNSAIDGVATRMQDVRDEIAAYAASDLVCFRAGSPIELVERQSKAWDAVINWAKTAMKVRFVFAAGIMHFRQDQAALDAVTDRLNAVTNPCALAALNVLTTISGSALIALMLEESGMSVDQAWEAATVDESWNAETWGVDAEAEAQLLRRKADFNAAHLLMRALNT